MGHQVTAAYNESESNQINPHTSQPYINRYLEAITQGAMQLVQPGQQSAPIQQQVQAQPIQQAQQQGAATIQHVVPRDELRENRIMRQSSKVAADLLPMLGQEDQNLASLVRISEQLVQYFRDGVQWNVPSAGDGVEPVQAQAQGEQAPVYPDDDIPF
jgi:hypothetical protein